MNETIITNWNERVRDDDVAYILGDVALGRIAESLPLVQRLRGHKHLIAGNHDRCSSVHSRIRPVDVQRYFDAGFETIADGGFLRLQDQVFQVSHFPYAGDSHDADRFSEQRPKFCGFPLLCGHVHERWRLETEPWMLNVGVDQWNFSPVSEHDILALWRQSQELKDLPQALDQIAKSVGPWTDCPHCGADKAHQEVRNYDPIWHDGEVYCCNCGKFVRSWDAG